jgi:tetratricopeptide (TPR) repeat protein
MMDNTKLLTQIEKAYKESDSAEVHKLLGKVEEELNLQETISFYEQVLNIIQKLGEPRELASNIFNNLAGLYQRQGKYEQAEALYQRALAIREQVRGPDHPAVAAVLSNLAGLYQSQGKYEQAEALLARLRWPTLSRQKNSL